VWKVWRSRTKLHLTQEQAYSLIGGGPRVFQKYESGDLLPSHEIVSALVLLDNNPEGLHVLDRGGAKIEAAHRRPAPLFAISRPAGRRGNFWSRILCGVKGQRKCATSMRDAAKSGV